MKTFYLFIFALLTIFWTSCDKARVFEENKEIEKGLWDQNNKVTFKFDITDTVGWNNIYLNVRNAGGYQFSNLFLFITTQSPKGAIERDTVECILADEKGKWLGDGLGDIWDNQIPFKKRVRFPYKGTYTMSLEQAMRVNPLPFIMDVGIRIEKEEAPGDKQKR